MGYASARYILQDTSYWQYTDTARRVASIDNTLRVQYGMVKDLITFSLQISHWSGIMYSVLDGLFNNVSNSCHTLAHRRFGCCNSDEWEKIRYPNEKI